MVTCMASGDGEGEGEGDGDATRPTSTSAWNSRSTHSVQSRGYSKLKMTVEYRTITQAIRDESYTVWLSEGCLPVTRRDTCQFSGGKISSAGMWEDQRVRGGDIEYGIERMITIRLWIAREGLNEEGYMR